MKEKYKLVSAGNVEASCYFLIKERGYNLSIKDDLFLAENDTIIIKGYSQLELLGLISLYDKKGINWQVEDRMIDEFLNFIK